MARSIRLISWLLGAAVLLSLSGRPRPAAPVLSPLQQLWRALAGASPLSVRFSGALEAVPETRFDRHPVRADVVRRGRAEIERHAALDSSPQALRDVGLLRLAEGDRTKAVLSLEEAVRRSPGDAQLESDLSAVLLVRSEAEHRPLDLLKALEAVDHALLADPERVEGLFNRAEALTRLHLRRAARAAWGRYLRRDRNSRWAETAQARLKLLSEPSLVEQWKTEQSRLESAALLHERKSLLEIVARFRHLVRLEAEERGLPGWAAARQAGNRAEADRQLTILREVGSALVEVTGDTMIRDAAEGASGAAESSVDLSRLTAGYLAFGRGMEFYNDQKLFESRPLFAISEHLLLQAGSPFAGWAAFYGAICDHYSDPSRALRTFTRLQEETDPSRYPVLAGRAAWLLGTIANSGGRPEEALRHYHLAFSLLDRSVGPQLSSFVHLLLGEAHRSLGEIEEAWRERITALATLSTAGELRRVHSTLNEAADALLQEGHPEAALAFSDEALENARTLGKPTTLAEAGFQRSRALDELGRHAEALAQLREASRSLSEVGPGGIRDRLIGELALSEAEVLSGSEPAQAVDALGKSLTVDRTNGYFYLIPRLLTFRARARRALRDDAGAETDLQAAIEEYEQVRGKVLDQQLRPLAFERSQESFDEMIRLQAEHGRPDLVLDFAEKSRSRLLLDMVPAGPHERSELTLPEAMTAAEIMSRIPRDVALVEYVVLPDRLLAWVASRGSSDLMQFDVAATDLARMVESLRSSLERPGGAKEIRAASAALSEILLRQALPRVPNGTSIIFVPDRFLVRVPFAALLDPLQNHYLIQDRTVSVAPSATLYVTTLERSRALHDGGPPTLLAVGDPAFDVLRYPDLKRLPDADAEAAEVAGLFPGSEVLRGDVATRDAFLAGAQRHRILHFAGHTLLHPFTSRLSRLVFAPEGEGDAGALYAHEIARQRLDGTELVVLSACQAIDGGAGRESLTGLAAAFLAAGPPVVVSSLWNSEDRPTRLLMRAFYSALRRGRGPAVALREAQLQLLTSSDPSFRSPAYWAGFEAIGGALSQP
ncbi:MAG TPA: CHAT domain-containing protein [Thermoanaerobaculia bacterium]|nr:CHAT domain-containing protein [Thermoanaerobaculia bacterium]